MSKKSEKAHVGPSSTWTVHVSINVAIDVYVYVPFPYCMCFQFGAPPGLSFYALSGSRLRGSALALTRS